jgi:dihydroorotase
MTIQRCLNLIRSDDLKLHFAHVSAAESVQAIIEAKKRGLDFSAEVTPHHLLLDSTLLQSKKAFAKMVPPLRTSNDRNALWDGLNSGFIDILATDHAPHSFKEKKQDFLNAPSGIPGLETSLSLMMTCVNRNMMTLRKFVELTSENPARIFQINNKGKILENFDADLVVVDKHKKSKIDPETFYSKAHHTPFEGLEVQGIPIMTILAGRIVMKNGDILAKEGTGTIIKPQKKSMLV